MVIIVNNDLTSPNSAIAMTGDKSLYDFTSIIIPAGEKENKEREGRKHIPSFSFSLASFSFLSFSFPVLFLFAVPLPISLTV